MDLKDLNEAFRQVRVRGGSHLFKMGVVQTSLGATAIIVGILSLRFGVPTGSFPFFLGVPLWCGVLVLAAGLLALVGSREKDTEEGSATGRQRCFVVCHYVFTLLSLIISVVMPVFGGLGIFYCLNPGSTITTGGRGQPIRTITIYCEPYHGVNLALSGVSLALGILIVLFSIPFVVFFCCYATAYGFKNRRLQQQQMIQMQAQINSLEQQLEAKNYR